jgi:cysteine-rich repeat protein
VSLANLIRIKAGPFVNFLRMLSTALPAEFGVIVLRSQDGQAVDFDIPRRISVPLYSIRPKIAFLSLLLVPVVCLSMGGCPGPGGGAVCGNGSVEAGEQCDDGNTTAGDGCSAKCQDETGGECGDGTVETGEQCDDGNTVSDDGCSATCQTENLHAPAGADGDGVDDEIDECPGTARGVEVDATDVPIPTRMECPIRKTTAPKRL